MLKYNLSGTGAPFGDSLTTNDNPNETFAKSTFASTPTSYPPIVLILKLPSTLFGKNFTICGSAMCASILMPMYPGSFPPKRISCIAAPASTRSASSFAGGISFSFVCVLNTPSFSSNVIPNVYPSSLSSYLSSTRSVVHLAPAAVFCRTAAAPPGVINARSRFPPNEIIFDVVSLSFLILPRTPYFISIKNPPTVVRTSKALSHLSSI